MRLGYKQGEGSGVGSRSYGTSNSWLKVFNFFLEELFEEESEVVRAVL